MRGLSGPPVRAVRQRHRHARDHSRRDLSEEASRPGRSRTIAPLQYAGGILITLPAALLFAAPRFALTLPVVGALLWSVLALSIGAIALLLLLIRHGEASRAAQLIYLVPPAAALQGALLFGERLSLVQIAGFFVTIAGVILARS